MPLFSSASLYKLAIYPSVIDKSHIGKKKNRGDISRAVFEAVVENA